MLDFMLCKNTWNPPELSNQVLLDICTDGLPDNIGPDGDFFIIFQIEPYIDTIYVHFTGEDNVASMYKKRFVFREDYKWDYEDERLFVDRILNNNRLGFTCVIDRIFSFYSEKYPDWKLKRYYTKPMRLLDHIYHCMRKGSAKEMLYKAGLDELAAHIDDLDEIDLLSSKPSDIYSGISMRVLRSLNCRDGSLLLSNEDKRKFVKGLQMKFPMIFKEPLNDAQCRYLNYLIEGNLTVGEAGRLYNARRLALMMIWAPSQYELFIWKEKMNQEALRQANEIANIDPIYKDFVGNIDFEDSVEINKKIQTLRYYLLSQREEYDRKFRRSNRKRNQDWQERDKGYVVRYPQTINDFCRESIYMCNCLLTYVDAYIENDTTILLMRKADDYNAPFITIEIFQEKLMQAYHRFNEDCTQEEAEWILKYCDRHGIRRGNFKFNNDIDELM